MIGFIHIDSEWIIHQCELFTINTSKVPILKCHELSLRLLHNYDRINHRAISNSENTFRGYKVIIDNDIEIGMVDIIENKEN